MELPAYDYVGPLLESKPSTPLVLLFASGANPLTGLLSFAQHMHREVRILSPGQGQVQRVQRVVAEAGQSGRWVLLQNCHLEPGWLPVLAGLCRQLEFDQHLHPNFRLWLSLSSCAAFPITVLNNAIRIAVEAPQGLRASIQSSLAAQPFCEAAFFCGCPARETEWSRALYSLVYAHAVITCRRHAPLGWRGRPEFAEADLVLTAQQLQLYLLDIPCEDLAAVLRRLMLEGNYGGRVEEPQDMVLLVAIVDSYCSSSLLQEGDEGFYPHVAEMTHEGFCQHVAELPASAAPEAYGLHAAAAGVKDIITIIIIIVIIVIIIIIIITTSKRIC